MRILYIPNHNKETYIDTFFKTRYPESLIEKKPELIIVSGGDGSLLHAIQDYKYLKVPFFGIAAGTKNFLMNNIEIEDIQKIFKRKFNIIKASTLKVSVNRICSNNTKNIIFESSVTNDIVLGGEIMDFNTFNIENKIIKSMGIVISTPLGSTAFHYNNWGKIIKNIDSNEIGVATIVSDRSQKINKIINLKKSIEIKILSERSIVSLFIDGTTKIFKLKYGDIIEIKRNEPIELCIIDKKGFEKKRK